jgi:3-hydroxyethyl bacteriochlorophyllide a dehydrogenase
VDSLAIVIREPKRIEMSHLALTAPGAGDVLVDIAFSGVSSGTEKLIWSGDMPPFPGFGYPLVPGYEAVGRIAESADLSAIGNLVFVPGANCFTGARGLFGASASRLVVPASRCVKVNESLGPNAALLALAATAFHASAGHAQPDLIIGHGILGRLLARIAVLQGAAPIVWERNPARMDGAQGYSVCDPAADQRRDYRHIYDASGDAGLIDTLIGKLAPGGEIVLAGFYPGAIHFAFAPAFMREARLRIAAQWQPADLAAVTKLANDGTLNLAGLISHVVPAGQAETAYQTAFETSSCLKMIIDWRLPA